MSAPSTPTAAWAMRGCESRTEWKFSVCSSGEVACTGPDMYVSTGGHSCVVCACGHSPRATVCGCGCVVCMYVYVSHAPPPVPHRHRACTLPRPTCCTATRAGTQAPHPPPQDSSHSPPPAPSPKHTVSSPVRIQTSPGGVSSGSSPSSRGCSVPPSRCNSHCR